MLRRTAFLAVVPLAIAMLALASACTDDDDGGGGNGNGDEPQATAEPTAPVSSFAGRDPAVPFADVCVPGDPAVATEPATVIDTGRSYVATITTANGDIVVELFSDVPGHTNNFAYLACSGFYDGLSFHRVVADFVAQGGDPSGDCTGGPGYEIADEDSAGHTMDTGAISMAKSGPNTAGSQFFITYAPQPDLEADFTVFGMVSEGQDVLGQLTAHECGAGPVPEGNTITSVTIEEL